MRYIPFYLPYVLIKGLDLFILVLFILSLCVVCCVLCCLELCCVLLSCLVLCCVVSSCFVLSCLAVSCLSLVLSCLVLELVLFGLTYLVLVVGRRSCWSGSCCCVGSSTFRVDPPTATALFITIYNEYDWTTICELL